MCCTIKWHTVQGKIIDKEVGWKKERECEYNGWHVDMSKMSMNILLKKSEVCAVGVHLQFILWCMLCKSLKSPKFCAKSIWGSGFYVTSPEESKLSRCSSGWRLR